MTAGGGEGGDEHYQGAAADQGNAARAPAPARRRVPPAACRGLRTVRGLPDAGIRPRVAVNGRLSRRLLAGDARRVTNRR